MDFKFYMLKEIYQKQSDNIELLKPCNLNKFSNLSKNNDFLKEYFV